MTGSGLSETFIKYDLQNPRKSRIIEAMHLFRQEPADFQRRNETCAEKNRNSFAVWMTFINPDRFCGFGWAQFCSFFAVSMVACLIYYMILVNADASYVITG